MHKPYAPQQRLLLEVGVQPAVAVQLRRTTVLEQLFEVAVCKRNAATSSTQHLPSPRVATCHCSDMYTGPTARADSPPAAFGTPFRHREISRSSVSIMRLLRRPSRPAPADADSSTRDTTRFSGEYKRTLADDDGAVNPHQAVTAGHTQHMRNTTTCHATSERGQAAHAVPFRSAVTVAMTPSPRTQMLSHSWRNRSSSLRRVPSCEDHQAKTMQRNDNGVAVDGRSTRELNAHPVRGAVTAHKLRSASGKQITRPS